MKAIVLYYSYKGHTKKAAEKLAHTRGAELVEIRTKKRKNMLMTFLVDCPRARMRKTSAIEPLSQDLSGYDLITLAAPVWASYPAPAFNAMVGLLPKGKNIEVIMVSSGGDTKKAEEGTRKLIRKQGCTVVAYKDILGQA